MSVEWPLAGRAAELQRVLDHLRAAPPPSVVIAGPAGVGKSRLAAEAVRQGASSMLVERVIASQASAAIPFAAFAHLLPAQARSDADQLQLLLLARQAIAERTSGRVLLLMVDDAHLLDAGSATLLHRVVVDELARVLVTVRTGEPVPDPVRLLWKDGLAARVDLANLTRAATDELLHGVLGGRVEERTAQQLWDASRGNPLILRELVLGALDTGVLVREGLWHLTGALTPSRRLTEIVEARLERLTPLGRDTAEVLALARPLPMAVLTGVAGEGAVEALEAAGIARVETSGRRRDVHLWRPVHADVLRAAMPEMRRLRLASRVADALTATGARRRDDPLQVAVLRLETGSPCDPALLLSGAHRALASFDHVLAERLARGAVDNDGDGFEARLVLASARAGQKDAEEAERLFAAAAGLATGDAQRGRLALARAQNLLYGLRRADEGIAVLARARDMVTAPDWDDELTAMLAVFATLVGDPWAGVEAGRRIMQRPSARPRPVVATLVASTICQILLVDLTDIERALETGLRLAAEVEDELPIAATQLGIAAAAAQWLHGRVREGREHCRDGYRRTLQRTEDDLAGIWAANLAQLLSYGADPQEALTASAEAAELLRAHDALGLLPMALGCEILAAAHLGDLVLASELADDAALADAESELRSAVFVTRGRAWVAAAQGDRLAAAEALVEAGHRVAVGGIRFFSGILLHDVIRLGYPELAAEDLVALADVMDGEIPQLWAAHARALAAAEGHALDAVAERFGEIAMPLYAAETAAQAADAHRRVGNARAARRSTARVSAWQAAGSVAVTVTPMRLHPLTRREREVAMMAARGLTSPQIAQSLVLSQRTVDNHLRSVYGKLGVHGRRDLATVLSEWLAPPP